VVPGGHRERHREKGDAVKRVGATRVHLVHATSSRRPVTHLANASPPVPGLDMASLSCQPPGEDLLAGAGTLVSAGVLSLASLLSAAPAAIDTVMDTCV
jgi:hypothetical protein